MTISSVDYENARLVITNLDWDGDGDSEEIEFWFEKDALLKEVEEPQNTPTSVTEAGDPLNNAVMAWSGQRKEKTLRFRMYDNGDYNDKTKGTMAEAGIADSRIAPGAITDIDTDDDSVTTDGDHRDRVSIGDTVALDTKGEVPDNDGTYTVEDISYDSDNDETTFTLDGDLTDDTVIGALSHSVVTPEEQKVFWQRYIDASRLRVQGRLYGITWSDPDGDGNEEGTPVRVKRFRPRVQSDNPLRADGLVQMDVGFSI